MNGFKNTLLIIVALLLISTVVAIIRDDTAQIHQAIPHKCMHDTLRTQNPNLKFSSRNKGSQRYPYTRSQVARMPAAQLQNVYSPIRVKFINDPTSMSSLTQAQLNTVATSMANIRTTISNMLSVIPVSGNLRASSTTCGNVNVASLVSANGISNTDLAIFVTYENTQNGAVRVDNVISF